MSLSQSKKSLASTEDFKNFVESILDQHKANDIVSIDISKKSNLAQYMIIASGESSLHVKSLAKYVKEAIRTYKKLSIEGLDEGNWVVITFQDIILHIFRPEVRQYYKLEDLWNNQPLPVEEIDKNNSELY